jgi:hypothetical protein
MASILALTVEAAGRNDLDAVMSLLQEARDWQRGQGVDEWREFDPNRIAADIVEGHVFVARSSGPVLGTVTLLESDALVWGTDPCRAIYVHKLASSRRPDGRGVGAIMLRWVQGFARRSGKYCVKLDTWDNLGTRLRPRATIHYR